MGRDQGVLFILYVKKSEQRVFLLSAEKEKTACHKKGENHKVILRPVSRDLDIHKCETKKTAKRYS